MSNILIFGDSIGYGCDDTQGGWIDRIKKEFFNYSKDKSLKHDLKVYNLAISGDTTSDVLKRIQVELKARNWDDQPTKIIFAIGINDSVFVGNKTRTSRKQFIENLSLLIKTARASGVVAAFVGLTPVDETKTNPIPWDEELSMNNEIIEEYDAMIRGYCSDNAIRFIDIFNTVDQEEFVKLLPDGLHPDTKGHDELYKIIKPALTKELMIK